MSQTSPKKKLELVLIHGFRGSPIGLQTLAKELKKQGYAVYTPAIPPFGGAKRLSQYTPEAYAKYFADYIQENHLNKPVLIGHSMGSIIVAAIVSQYPELVNNKTILLSPISERTTAPLRIIAPLSAILPSRIVDNITTRYLLVPHDRDLLHEVLETTHQCSHDQPPAKSALLGAAKFSTSYSVADFYIPQKVLLLAGEKDRLVSKKHTIKTAHKLQAETTFLPGCGHLHNYEKPQETAQKIIEFLEK